MSDWIPRLCQPHEWMRNHVEPIYVVVHIVQAQEKSGPPVQGSQRSASICRQYLLSIILNMESVEESSEHFQTTAQPSLVGV